jgi:hypothetical protein
MSAIEATSPSAAPSTSPRYQALLSPERRGLAMGVMQNFGSNLLGSFAAPVLRAHSRCSWGPFRPKPSASLT